MLNRNNSLLFWVDYSLLYSFFVVVEKVQWLHDLSLARGDKTCGHCCTIVCWKNAPGWQNVPQQQNLLGARCKCRKKRGRNTQETSPRTEMPTWKWSVRSANGQRGARTKHSRWWSVWTDGQTELPKWRGEDEVNMRLFMLGRIERKEERKSKTLHCVTVVSD